MVDAATLANIDLEAPEGQEAVRRIVHDAVRFGEARAAFRAAKIVTEHIKGNAKLERQYAEQIALLKAAALPLLSDEGAVTVFGEYLPVILAQPDVDLIHGLRMKSIGMPEEDLRRFFANVISVMAGAQVALTAAPLALPDGSARPPTLASWTAALRTALDGSNADAVSTGPLVEKLDGEEKQKVLRLTHVLDMAQRLAKGEMQPADIVIREDDGKVKVVSGDSVMPVASATPPAPPATPAQQSISIPPRISPQPHPEKISAAPAEMETKNMPAALPPTMAKAPVPVLPIPQPKPPVSQLPSVPRLTPPQATPQVAPQERMQTLPPITEKGPIAQTQYSLEDEEEIQHQMARLRDIGSEPSADQVLDTKVDQLIREQQLTFDDENLRSRFQMMMETYVKGIRNSVETEEILRRPVKIGGMGYDDAQAHAIMESAKMLIAKRQDHAGVQELVDEARKLEAPEGMPSAPPVPAAPSVPETPLVREERAAIPASHERTPIIVKQEPKTTVVPPLPVPAAPQPHRQAMAFSRNATGRGLFRRQPKTKRPSVADITGPKKLSGPTEEIRSMSLEDFRKLGPTPRDRVQKLFGRFVSLQKESFTMRMEGVKAWRTSPVYQLYLALGTESMNTGKSIADVIVSRTSQGKEVLNEEEFHYIADLNRQLQFA